MAETMQPLSIGELLDRAIQLYRKHFGLFSGIAAWPFGCVLALQILSAFYMAAPIATAPVSVNSAATMPSTTAVGYALGIAGLNFLIAIMTIFATAYVNGGTIVAVSSFLREQPFTVSQTWPSLKGSLWRIMRTAFLAGLYAFIPVICLGIVILLSPPLTVIGRLFFIVLFLLTIVLAIWIYLRYAMGVPATVIEKVNARESLRRSARLSEGFRGRIFLAYLLIVVLELIFYAVAAGLGAILGVFHPGNAMLLGRIMPFVSYGINVLVLPFASIPIALIYFDLRVRKEGWDLELLLDKKTEGHATA